MAWRERRGAAASIACVPDRRLAQAWRFVMYIIANILARASGYASREMAAMLVRSLAQAENVDEVDAGPCWGCSAVLQRCEDRM
jgi:hypothetical protein